ncbi:hypothetical protein L873DRAFT_1804603 [Choiromyces venosus 120613-1]|uniref:Uncharacterized protein n=1 Tax=Choiromyces venosus 120613-1 TaxID=1336337 RepID=A0A3N4JRB6_9PEZI|nr:hypothetical protein L873DRAFT_1804603 [Choiromyces venosus 120613-1]
MHRTLPSRKFQHRGADTHVLSYVQLPPIHSTKYVNLPSIDRNNNNNNNCSNPIWHATHPPTHSTPYPPKDATESKQPDQTRPAKGIHTR